MGNSTSKNINNGEISESDETIKTELAQLNESCKLNNIPYYFSDRLRLSSLCPIFIGCKSDKKEEQDIPKPEFILKTVRYDTEYQKFRINEEINIINRLSNEPNIIHFLDDFDLSYKDQNCKFFVTNYYVDSDLYEFVQKNKDLTEDEKCYIIYQMLEILQSLKKLKILHNDIKLENFIMKSVSPPKILLTDFDFAEIINKSSCHKRGTIPYTAPEILRDEPHDYEADIWSLGVCAFYFLFEVFPFNFKKAKLFDKNHIMSCLENNELVRPKGNDVSDDAWEFVSELLKKDQTERITVEKAINMNWFKNKKFPEDSTSNEKENIKN